MKKIKEFSIVKESTLNYLTEVVNRKINEGWQPIGEITEILLSPRIKENSLYCIQMVKYEDS